jgi:3',5'-cyclic AMP phosphodiesterase CpdA
MRTWKQAISAVLALLLLTCFSTSALASGTADWADRWDDAVSDETVISLSPGTDETQVCFRWLSPLGAMPSFRCAKQDDLTDADACTVQTSPTVTGQKKCTVTVNGLERGTTYYYAYVTNGVWSETFSFRTAADTLTALFVSDSQLGRSGDWRDKDVLLHDVAGWDTTLREATAVCPDISLCLSAGDQAEIAFAEKQYRLLLAPDVMRSLPIATTIGNHEFYFPYLNLHFAHPNRFAGSMLHSLGDEPYYFTQNDVLFIVLDSNDPIAWDHEILLERAVHADPDAKWRVVMMHHSLYSCEDSFEKGPAALRDKLVPLLQKYGVDLVLSGHTHRFSRSYPLLDNALSEKGITYLEGGCCSGCNCKASPQPLPSYSAAGYPQTNPVYSVLQFTDEEIAIRSFAVEDGQSVQIDSVTLSRYARDDAQAHASRLVRVLQGVLSLLGRAVSVVFV